MECRDQALSKDRHCWPATEVNVKGGVKEETMKKFICIAVAFMLMLILIGCFATMTPEERKETYDLRGSVGNQPFIGSTGGLDSRGLFYAPVTMY